MSHQEIMNNVVSIERTGQSDTGEGIFDVLTEYGYIYSDIPEATIKDLRPDLIY